MATIHIRIIKHHKYLHGQTPSCTLNLDDYNKQCVNHSRE